MIKISDQNESTNTTNYSLIKKIDQNAAGKEK
jgi:hypothetical protein